MKKNEILKKIRANSGKTETNPKLIGISGEYLTQYLLDYYGIPWIKIDRSANIYSNNLICENNGKRPDYLISIDDNAYFLDSKFITIDCLENTRSAKISVDEVNKQKSTSKLYGIPALYIIWGRNMDDFQFVFEYVDNFISEKEVSKISYNFIDFNVNDFGCVKFEENLKVELPSAI